MPHPSSQGMSSPSSGQKRKEREAGKEEGEVEQAGVRRKLSEEFKAVQTPKRKAAGETDSPGSSATKFYRLDYLFGKSSEKVARQTVKPLTEPQQAALVSLEAQQQDSTTVVLPAVGVNRGGRPRGAGRWRKQAAGVRKHRADPSARAKLELAQKLQEKQQQPGVSRRAARQQISREYGLSLTAVRNLEKEEVVSKLKAFVESREIGKGALRQRGSSLAGIKQRSQSQGKRVAQPGNILGKTDHLRPIWLQSAVWGQTEEQQGHMISLHDLMRDFEHRVQSAIARKMDLGETDTAEFTAWQKKLNTIQNNPKQRDREARKLATRAGLRDRKPQQTQNISEAELKTRLEAAWRWYDRTLFEAAQPVLQPGLPVRDRESFLLHRAGTALTFSEYQCGSSQPQAGF